MAVPPALSAHFDHAQPRYSRDRLGIAIAGLPLWQPEYSSDTIVEPVTNSVILKPLCYDPTWETSNTGDYAKLALSDFGSPAGFIQADRSGTGVKKYIAHGLINQELMTTATWAKNTGFVVSFVNYSNGSTTGVLLECGWASSSDLAENTAFRLYGNGIGEIWRGGIRVSSGYVGLGGGVKQNETCTLILMPCRRKELLVWAEGGTGIRGVFGDIDDYDTDPEITPSANFWVRQPNVSMCVMVAPLHFKESGYAVSELYTLAEPPEIGDTLEESDNETWAGGSSQPYRLFGDESYRTGNSDAASASLVEDDGVTAFVPDGVLQDVRIKLSLSGDGDSSPTIYGADLGFANVPADTDDSEVYDATDYLTEWQLSVPDGKEGAVISARFNRDDVLYAAVAGIEEQCFRPMRFDIGTTTILDGIAGAPSFERLKDEQAQDIHFEISDYMKALSSYRFRELKPFDGMYVSHSSGKCLVRFLLNAVGWPDSAMSLETATVPIDSRAPETCGDWAEFADVGATALEILDRFMEDYLGGWFYGFVPTSTGVKFVTKSPTTLAAQSPVFKLYWSTADAIADGVAAEDAWKHVYWTSGRDVVEPEGNEVIISGRDQRTKLLIGSRKRDAAAQDPTLAPSARASNWAGFPLRIGLVSGGISSQNISNEAASLMFGRSSVARIIEEVGCEMMIRDTDGLPVWRGDKITLDGIGDLIIQSFNVSSKKEPNGTDTWQRRVGFYVASNIMGKTGGVSKARVKAIHSMMGRCAFVIRRNSRDTAKSRRQSIVEVP